MEADSDPQFCENAEHTFNKLRDTLMTVEPRPEYFAVVTKSDMGLHYEVDDEFGRLFLHEDRRENCQPEGYYTRYANFPHYTSQS